MSYKEYDSIRRAIDISREFIQGNDVSVHEVSKGLFMVKKCQEQGFAKIDVYSSPKGKGVHLKYTDIKVGDLRSRINRFNPYRENITNDSLSVVLNSFNIHLGKNLVDSRSTGRQSTSVEYNGANYLASFSYNYNHSGNCGAVFISNLSFRRSDSYKQVIDCILMIMGWASASMMFCTDRVDGEFYNLLKSEAAKEHFDKINFSNTVRNPNSGNKIVSISASLDIDDDDDYYDEDDDDGWH